MNLAGRLICILVAFCAGALAGCSQVPQASKEEVTLASTNSSNPETLWRERVHALRGRLLDEKLSLAEREDAGIELGSTKEGGDVLLSLAAQSKISPELMPVLSEAILRNPDFGVRALASRHFARSSRTGEAFPEVHELTQMKGEASRGKQLFFSATAGCSKCHTHSGQGGDFGPDLTRVQAKLPRDTIFDAILNPTASIMFGYDVWLFETKDGESYTGFILSEDEKEVMLKTGSGHSITIAAADIALRQPQSLSLMPDNIAIGLTAQELADLVEFLATP